VALELRCSYLLLRVHVLRCLRSREAGKCLSELWWGIRATTDPTCSRVAPGPFRCKAPSLGYARTSVVHSGRDCKVLRVSQGHGSDNTIEEALKRRAGLSVTRPATTSSAKERLRAAAAELGLGRAVEILQGERARVRAVLSGTRGCSS